MESRENRDISKELNVEKYKEDARLLETAKEKMLATGLFDKDFIDGLSFVFVDAFEKDGEYQEVEYRLTEDGSVVSYKNENSDRTKEVGIVTLSLLGKIDQFFDIHDEKNKSQHIWLGDLDKSIFLSFDAVVAHEIAHAKSYGAIDKERKSFFDEEKFKALVVELTRNNPVLSKDNSVDLSKFDYSDENWSELYALLYHREFLRRENSDNIKMIKEWDNHIVEVASDLQGAMKKFNQEKNTNIDPEVIYKDGHAFSYLLARVFEEKYKDFDERIKVFERCKREQYIIKEDSDFLSGVKDFDESNKKTKAEKIKERLKVFNYLERIKDYYKWKFPETVANITKIANNAGFKNLFIHVDAENMGGEFEDKRIHIKKGYENCVFFPNKGMENQQLLEKIDKDFADKGLGIVMRHEKEHFKGFAKNYSANKIFFSKEYLAKLTSKELNKIKEKDDYADYILEELTRFGESQTNLQSIMNDPDSEKLVDNLEESKDRRVKKIIDDIATESVYVQSVYEGVDSLRVKKVENLDDFLVNFANSLRNRKSLDINYTFLKPEIIKQINEKGNEIRKELLKKYDKLKKIS